MKVVAGLALVAIVASLAYLGWYLRQGSRPGAYHYRRGLAFVDAKQPKEAVKEWLQGAQKDPSDPRCPEMLGDFFHESGRFPEAATFYGQAVKHERDDGTLFLRYSQSLHHVGDKSGALAAAERAARLLPKNPDALGHYGLQLAGAKKRPEALAALRKAHALAPENRLYHLALVELEMDTLQLGEAEAHLRQYLSKHPKDSEALFKMAVLFNQKPRTPDNLKTAIRYAEQALPGMSEDARGYSVLGQLYLEAGRTRDALQLLRLGDRLVPNSEGILRGLADCYTRLGDTRQLAAVSERFRKVVARHDRIDHLKHVMGFNPQDWKSGLELGRLQEEEGRPRDAERVYTQLVRQEPANRTLRSALSNFYRRTKRMPLAQKALDPSFVP